METKIVKKPLEFLSFGHSNLHFVPIHVKSPLPPHRRYNASRISPPFLPILALSSFVFHMNSNTFGFYCYIILRPKNVPNTYGYAHHTHNNKTTLALLYVSICKGSVSSCNSYTINKYNSQWRFLLFCAPTKVKMLKYLRYEIWMVRRTE